MPKRPEQSTFKVNAYQRVGKKNKLRLAQLKGFIT